MTRRDLEMLESQTEDCISVSSREQKATHGIRTHDLRFTKALLYH